MMIVIPLMDKEAETQRDQAANAAERVCRGTGAGRSVTTALREATASLYR